MQRVEVLVVAGVLDEHLLVDVVAVAGREGTNVTHYLDTNNSLYVFMNISCISVSLYLCICYHLYLFPTLITCISLSSKLYNESCTNVLVY